MGILGITMGGMLWALTQGARTFEKLKGRLVAIKLLQERMETLDARFNPDDLPDPVGPVMNPLDTKYERVSKAEWPDPEHSFSHAEVFNGAGEFQSCGEIPDCAKLSGVFEAPLSNFGYVEYVLKMDPTKGGTLMPKTKLRLYKIQVQVFWPAEKTPAGGAQKRPGSETIEATTMLLRVRP